MRSMPSVNTRYYSHHCVMLQVQETILTWSSRLWSFMHRLVIFFSLSLLWSLLHVCIKKKQKQKKNLCHWHMMYNDVWCSSFSNVSCWFYRFWKGKQICIAPRVLISELSSTVVRASSGAFIPKHPMFQINEIPHSSQGSCLFCLFPFPCFLLQGF